MPTATARLWRSAASTRVPRSCTIAASSATVSASPSRMPNRRNAGRERANVANLAGFMSIESSVMAGKIAQDGPHSTVG